MKEKLSPWQIGHLYSSFLLKGKRSSRVSFINDVGSQEQKKLFSSQKRLIDKPVFKPETAALINEALKTGGCFGSFSSAKNRSDDYFFVDFNNRYLSVKWFGSENGSVVMPRISSQDEATLAKKTQSLNGTSCKSIVKKQISYYPVGGGKNRRWIPFIPKNTAFDNGPTAKSGKRSL